MKDETLVLFLLCYVFKLIQCIVSSGDFSYFVFSMVQWPMHKFISDIHCRLSCEEYDRSASYHIPKTIQVHGGV